MYVLYIANKNYSSWSLRPWLLMRELGVPFEERLMPFAGNGQQSDYQRFSPSARVPCLHDGGTVVWDSLAITEYLAERHSGVWPTDAQARAFARCAAAEMHSGFGALRSRCSMNVGVRVKLREMPAALTGDVGRLDALWSEGLRRFGGPWLAGARFTAADAFFAPVAFRAQTYGLTFGAESSAYVARLLALPEMKAWEAAALAETWRDEGHEDEVRKAGEWLQDLRAK